MATEKATPKRTAKSSKPAASKSAGASPVVSDAPGVDLAAVGKWSFLIGLALAAILGVLPSTQLSPMVSDWARYLLMLLGLVGGVLFVNKAEENSFIILSIGLALFGNSLGAIPQIGNYLSGINGALVFFLGFAVIGIVARNIISWFTR